MTHAMPKPDAPSSDPAVASAPQQTPEEWSDKPTAAASRGRERRWRRFILVGLVILLLGFSTPYGWELWLYHQTHESTDDAYVVGDIVPISAHVSARVLAVHVEEHQRVQAGQLLAQLDPRDFTFQVQQTEAARAVAQARLLRAEFEVVRERDRISSDTDRTSATVRAAQSGLHEAQHATDEAQARVRTLETAVAVAHAEVATQQARLDMAHMTVKRMQQLLADGIVAQQQFDEASSHLRVARAEKRASQEKLAQAQSEVERARVDLRMQQQGVEQARARVAEARAVLAGSQADHQNVAIKQAEVEVARARLQQQQVDLAYATSQLADTTLRAPVDGVVAKMRLEKGQMVQAGQPLLALVPLDPVWVVANFKETQLRRMRPGQPATLKVDAYPDQPFPGTVESMSPGTGSVFSMLPPENATGNFIKVVQRVPVKIVLDAGLARQATLRPGMSVVATVNTH